MDEFFSNTAYKRLPAQIRKLSKEAQTVAIYLRIRKPSEQIALETGWQLSLVEELSREVKTELVKCGKFDIISDPIMVQYEGGCWEPTKDEIAPEDKLMLDQFLSALNDAVKTLPKEKRQLLHLAFQQKMSLKDISAFLKKMGDKKSEPETAKLLENSLQELLLKVDETTPIGRGNLTVSSLKNILSETGATA